MKCGFNICVCFGCEWLGCDGLMALCACTARWLQASLARLACLARTLRPPST